jgi:Na+/melibiose symporter-like transporter
MLPLPDISRQHKVALGFGFLALFFANNSLSAMAVPYFQMTLGLDPFWLSLVIAAPIICAAFISQVVGRVSDRLNTKHGNRRFLLLVSGISSGVLFSAIWQVPSDASQIAILAYVLTFNFLFSVALTFLTINVKSLAFDLSRNETQRVNVMAFGSFFERLGTFAYFWLFPLAQLSLWGGVYIGIQYVGWIVGIVLIGLFSIVTAWCRATVQRNTESRTDSRQKPVNVNPIVLRNRGQTPHDVALVRDPKIKLALYLLLGLTLIKFGAISIFTSFDYYLLVYFVKHGDIATGAYWKGILSSAFALFTLIMIPIFSHLTLKLGKLKTLSIIYWLTALGALLKWFIYQPGFEWMVVIDALLGAPSWVAISVVIPSMLADLCAYERRLSGHNKVGYFVSIQNKVINFALVSTMIGAGMLLNIVGFDANAGSEQSANSIFWMRVCLAGGPLILCFVSLFLVKMYPLSDQQMALNENALVQT